MDIMVPFCKQLVSLLEKLVLVEEYLAKARAEGETPEVAVATARKPELNLDLWLHGIAMWCTPLACKASLERAESLGAILKSEDERNRLFASGELEFTVRDLRKTVQADYGARHFYYVPQAMVTLYKGGPDLFGEEVNARFGKISFHIEEAGKCQALGRSTAAVYHLMCILDVGLDSLCYAVGLPYSRRNWNVIFQELGEAIGAITVPDQREFYGRAVLEFKFFRDAWRNHTQHGRAKHTESEAMRIYEHVQAFMQHLATRLQERPGTP